MQVVLYMNFYQFELFCMVVRTKSISKAARNLHLSQPAVSQQIQAMEGYYNVTLFNRSPQGVTLTVPGKVVYDYAQKFMTLFSDLEHDLDKLMGAENSNLVIGASTTIGNYSIPCSLWAFKQKNPQVNLRLDIKNSSEIFQGLVGNEYDLGLIEGETDTGNIIKRKIHEYPLNIITPNQEPWTDMDSVSLEEITKTPLIIREKESGTRMTFEKFLKQNQIDLMNLNIITEMTSISAIKSAVQAGLGISFCPDIAVKKEVKQGSLLALPIKDFDISIPYYLIYQPEKFLSSIAKTFVRFVILPDQRFFC
jgi:DNA-binding transcriptional LysR family regulator